MDSIYQMDESLEDDDYYDPFDELEDTILEGDGSSEEEDFQSGKVTKTQADNFLIRIYRYYLYKGYTNLIVSQIVELLMLTFLVFFVTVLFQCIDYDALLKARNPSVIYKASDFLEFGNLFHLNWYFVICLILYSFYVVWKTLRISYDLRVMRGVRKFYSEKLHIDDFELGTTKWSVVVDKIKNLQKETDFYDGDDELNAHNIANRLMRKENYMTAMITQRVLRVKYRNLVFFSKSLEWNLNFAILNFFFDKQQKIKSELLEPENRLETIRQLRKRFIVMGIVNAILAPFSLLFASLYILFEHGQEFYRNPSQISGRNWSSLAKWKFKQYNELPHVFYERMRIANKFSEQYLDQFPNTVVSQISKLIAFIMSTWLGVILFLTLLNEHILFNVEFSDHKSFFWYASIFSTILVVAKGLSKKSYIFYPKQKLTKVSKYVHYIPEKWVRTASSSKTRSKFTKLYEMRLLSIFKEISSIIFNPIILAFYMPDRSEKILNFISHHTLDHPNLGKVCGFCVFEVENNQDIETGSGVFEETYTEKMTELAKHSAQNKVEKSATYFYHHQEVELQQEQNPPASLDPEFMANSHRTVDDLEQSQKFELDKDVVPHVPDSSPLYTSSLLIEGLVETNEDDKKPKKTTIFDILRKGKK